MFIIFSSGKESVNFPRLKASMAVGITLALAELINWLKAAKLIQGAIARGDKGGPPMCAHCHCPATIQRVFLCCRYDDKPRLETPSHLPVSLHIALPPWPLKFVMAWLVNVGACGVV